MEEYVWLYTLISGTTGLISKLLVCQIFHLLKNSIIHYINGFNVTNICLFHSL